MFGATKAYSDICLSMQLLKLSSLDNFHFHKKYPVVFGTHKSISGLDISSVDTFAPK